MNKLKENKQTLDDAEMLIKMQNEYINKLRNIVLRYYARHGRIIKSGKLKIKNQIDFEINFDDESAFIEVIDYKILGSKSNFELIKGLCKKLGL